ncbi:MAG: alpha/beta hydrolase [Ferruginibacter sp.]
MKYLIAALVIFLISCSSKKTARSHVPAKSGEVDIAYDLKGNGDTAIVFVHGWAINKEYWKSQEELLSHRFTTVAIDLGGHGQSGRNRNSWTVYDYANDVIAVLDALKLDKVILIGHSMSGDVVTAVTDSIPGRVIGLIGIDNFKSIITSYSKEEQESIDTFLNTIHTRYDSAITAYSYASLFPPKYTDSASMKRVVKDILNTDTTVSINTLKAIIQGELTAGERLSKIKIPVHVITSEYAPVNKAVMEKYCTAGFKEKIIKGTGHYPMIEQPGEFNRLLLETINDIAAGK